MPVLNNLNNWFTVFVPERALAHEDIFLWARLRGCYSCNPRPEYAGQLTKPQPSDMVWSYKVYLPE